MIFLSGKVGFSLGLFVMSQSVTMVTVFGTMGLRTTGEFLSGGRRTRNLVLSRVKLVFVVGESFELSLK